MPIYARKKEGEYIVAPEGLWPAVCCDVHDLGLVDWGFGPQAKIEISWQLEEREPKTNKRYLVSWKGTPSLHEKSKLRPLLESWRGRKFTKEEEKEFDIEKLLGANCQLQVVHNIKENGATYANVQACVPYPRNVARITVEDYTRKIDREKHYEDHPDDVAGKQVDEYVPSNPSKRENRSGSRWYKIGDVEYPSVTTILSVIAKPALIAWSANTEREMVMNASVSLYNDLSGTPKMSPAAYLMSLKNRVGTVKAGQKEMQKAMDIGSQAHKLIEWNLKARLMEAAGPSPVITDKALWAFMAWEDWKKSVDLKPVYVEQTVWSDKYGFAGTMDLLAEVNGKLTVVDWKTGKAIYPEAYLQNAAYRHAFREMGHGDPVQGMIVRLPKNENDPEFEAQTIHDSEDSLFETFLHCFELWKWNQKGEEAYQAKAKVA